MPAGRPTDYRPEYCERIVALGNEGASVVEMAYECGCTKQTLLNWTEAHPEFLDAFTRAKTASQVWWERKGRVGMEKSSQEFQASIWSRSMAARFPEDWRETKATELSGPNGSPITVRKADLSDDELAAIASGGS